MRRRRVRRAMRRMYAKTLRKVKKLNRAVPRRNGFML